jgi:hypothetical protein
MKLLGELYKPDSDASIGDRFTMGPRGGLRLSAFGVKHVILCTMQRFLTGTPEVQRDTKEIPVFTHHALEPGESL